MVWPAPFWDEGPSRLLDWKGLQFRAAEIRSVVSDGADRADGCRASGLPLVFYFPGLDTTNRLGDHVDTTNKLGGVSSMNNGEGGRGSPALNAMYRG